MILYSAMSNDDVGIKYYYIILLEKERGKEGRRGGWSEGGREGRKREG